MRLFFSADTSSRYGILSIILLVVLLLVLTGCLPKQQDITAPVDTPDQFSDSGTEAVPDRWWKTLGDTALNRLVQASLNENFNLKVAWSRLKQARAVRERESSSLYPSLDASAGGEINRNGTDNELLSLGLTADYEVDLWGRIESNVEAEEYRARASYADYQTAAISLSAEVARTWYQLVEQYHQLNVLNQQIKTNRKVLDLIKSRFGSGQVRSADILRQQQLLESTREQKITVQSRIEVLNHQLAVLLGKSPQKGIRYQSGTMPDLPPLPKTGLPVELVQRRPDVRSAYLKLKAANEELAAAISNQYPRLTLTASTASTDDNASELFDNWARSFAADLTAPLLDAGEREAEVDRSRAVRQQQLYEYGQSILTAFRDVEDALIREKKQAERIRNLREQLNLAQRTIERLRTQYFNGTGDYIDVLNALTEEQQLRRDILSARLALVEHRLSLYRALAGGFEADRSGKIMAGTDNS